LKDKNNIEIICTNVGDSRCVFCYENKVIPMSIDHKPNNNYEKKRILKANGFLENNRVNGNLALSRSFGDILFKNNKDLKRDEQLIISKPDIKRVTINMKDFTKKYDKHSFLILACDGVWDVISNEDIVQLVLSQINNQINELKKGKENILDSLDFGVICEYIIDLCVNELKSRDNVSISIIYFQKF
jgi:protein phosphatase PTC2/3